MTRRTGGGATALAEKVDRAAGTEAAGTETVPEGTVSDAPPEAPAAPAAQDGDRDAEAAGAPRPMRADARRNYERLIAAARDVFARDGTEASMEAIAKEAGVGVGTLYRHFPKRIDLVEAVYRNDVEELLAAGERQATELEPWPALVAWLEGYVRYAQSKRLFFAELQEAFERNPEFKLRSRERIWATTAAVLERAQRAGVARRDIDGNDLMALVGPMCMQASLATDQGWRLIAMIIDGLRPLT
jgi:AcrR family transcriptional regulator